eukprot:1379961-Rhodomonas_salina.2
MVLPGDRRGQRHVVQGTRGPQLWAWDRGARRVGACLSATCCLVLTQATSATHCPVPTRYRLLPICCCPVLQAKPTTRCPVLTRASHYLLRAA